MAGPPSPFSMPPPEAPPPGGMAPNPGYPASYRSGTTTASGVIGIILSAFWVLIGLFLLMAGLVIDEATDDTFWGEDVGDGVSAALVFASVLVLACAIWSIVAAANLIRRRSWARLAVIITYSIWTGVAVLGLIGSFSDTDSSDGDGSNGGGIVLTLLWLGACIAVVVFASVRSTKIDVEQSSRTGGFGAGPPMPPPLYGTDMAGPQMEPPGYGAPPPPAPAPGLPQHSQQPPPYGQQPPPYGQQPPQDPFAPPGSF